MPTTDATETIDTAPANAAPATSTSTTEPTTADAVAHFAAKLQFETDPSDVHADQESGRRFVLIDSRAVAAWEQGRATGAVHLPTREIAARAATEIPLDMPVVVYCWGPGCNGATRAALEFARLGYRVKEMIGGYEYWAREGYPIENDTGAIVRTKDELTAPVSTVTCAC